MKKKLIIISGIVLTILVVLVVFILPRQSNIHNNGPVNSISANLKTISPAQSLKIDSLSGSDILTLYIDRSTGFLKSLQPDQVLYAKPVYVFSYKYPMVAILERTDRSFITLFNLKTKQTKQYKIAKENGFISISLSADSSSLFALGSFSTTDQSSQLYLINVSDGSNNAISRVVASEVNAINNNQVVLFHPGEGQNSSSISVYNTQSKLSVFASNQVNEYLLSPNGTNVLVRSGSMASIINIGSQKKNQFSIDENDLTVWKDETNLIIVKNTFPGIQIASFNTETDKSLSGFSLIQNLKDRSAIKAISFFNNQLVLLDNMYRFFFVTLP